MSHRTIVAERQSSHLRVALLLPSYKDRCCCDRYLKATPLKPTSLVPYSAKLLIPRRAAFQLQQLPGPPGTRRHFPLVASCHSAKVPLSPQSSKLHLGNATQERELETPHTWATHQVAVPHRTTSSNGSWTVQG